MKMNMAISLCVREGKSKPEGEGHDFFKGIRGIKFNLSVEGFEVRLCHDQ